MIKHKINSKNIFIGIVVALMIALMAGPGEAQQPAAQEKDETAIILLVPFAFGTRATLAEGCWAQIFDGHNFTGRRRTIVGPLHLPNMRMPDASNWEGEIDSIIVGPKATVTVYSEENFQDKEATFNSNTRTANITQVPLGKDVKSMKLTCSGTTERN